MIIETTAANPSLRDFRASAELNSTHYFLIIQVAISRLGRVVESWKMPTFLCFPVAWETDETGSQGPLTCPEVHHTFISRSSHTLLVQKCWELANHPAIIPKHVIKPQPDSRTSWKSPPLRAGPLLQLPVSSSPRIQRISYENEAKTQKMLHWTWGGTYLDGTYWNLSSYACHPIYLSGCTASATTMLTMILCKSFRWFFAPFHEVMSFPNNYSLYLLAAWLIQLWKWTKHIVKPCYILIHTEWGTVQSANSSLSTACATFSPRTLQMILPLITVTVIWYLVYLSTWLVHLVQHVSCNGPSGSAMWSAL